MFRPPLLATLFPYTTLFRSLSNWASWARDLGYDYTTVAIPSGGWWLLGVGPRHYPTADRLGRALAIPATPCSSGSCGDRVFEWRSEEHTSELQSRFDLVCRL